MKFSRWLAGAGFALSALTAFGSPPYPAQLAEHVESGRQIPAGFTRLRVSLSINDALPERGVHVGGLTVCSDKACYQSTVAPYVDLGNTAAGRSTTITTIVVPNGRIRSVHFENVAGPKAVTGEISLPHPLEIEDGFFGGEVLVILDKKVANGRMSYIPASVATNLYHEEGTSIYYNPRFATKADLKLGAALSIPAGATNAPQVFSVAVHDTGDEFPLIDIYPEIPLRKSASVTVPAIVRPAQALVADEPAATPRPRSAAAPGARQSGSTAQGQPGVKNLSIQKTGVLAVTARRVV